MLFEIAISSIIKGSLLLMLALLLVRYSQRNTAADKHNKLAAALLVLLLVPFLELAPKLGLQILPADTLVGAQSVAPWLTPSRDIINMVVGVYTMGVIVCLLRVYLDYRALRQQLRAARLIPTESLPEPVREIVNRSARPISLSTLDNLRGPITVGEIAPKIILPHDFFCQDDKTVFAAIHHELAHIRRRDWTVQFITRLIVALFWFNPLVHSCARSLRDHAEIAADDEVVLAGDDATTYAGVLLSFAQQSAEKKRQRKLEQQKRTLQPLPIWMAMLGPGIAARIHSLTQNTPRRYYDGFGLSESIAGFILLLLPLTVIEAVPVKENAGFAEVIATVAVNPSPYPLFICRLPPYSTIDEPIKAPPPPRMEFARWQPSAVPQARFASFTMDAPHAIAKNIKLAAVTPSVSRIGFMPRVSAMPRYPERALRYNLEGFVDVVFDIQRDGSVTNARVTRSEPGRVFDRAALRAIRNSMYEPHQVNGSTVDVRGVENRYVFRLTDSGIDQQDQPASNSSQVLIAQGVQYDYL